MAANGRTAELVLDWTEGELAALETVEDFLPEQIGRASCRERV